MTRSEAEDLARKCKGSYPKMTDQHIAVLIAKAAPFDRQIAGKALSEFVDAVSEWDHARFMAVLGRVTIEADPANAPVTAVERTRRALLAENEVRGEVRAERERFFRIIDEMPEADLQRYRRAALAVMPSAFATRYADKDPRDSIYLIGLIVEQYDLEHGNTTAPSPDQKTLASGGAQ